MSAPENQPTRYVPLLSVIIPVYNEEKTINEIVRRVLAVDVNEEIILIDDGSSDSSVSLMEALSEQHPSVRLVKHERNQGKGAAVRTGIQECTGDIVLIQDADLEYDPRDYPKLLEPILEDRADAVFGSRFIGGESHRVLYFWHSVANKMLTLMSNMVTNLNLSDMEVCYKAVRREILQSLKLKESGFGFEPEITAKLARKRVRIYEVGISYSGRTYDEGKKIGIRDGLWAVWCIFKYGLLRL